MAGTIYDILRLHRAQLQGIIELRGVRRFKPVYEEVRAEIEAKLSDLKRRGMGQSFTAHHLRQVLLQIAEGAKQLQGKLAAHLDKTGGLAGTLAHRQTVQAVKILERKFTGTTPVLEVERAAVFRGIYEKVHPSLLDRYAQSSQLYGKPVVEKVKMDLAKSLIANETVDAAVDRVAAKGGIFDKERWRAERIVRTELSYSAGIVRQRSMETLKRDVPDMMKKLIETFDDRTGDDSKILHGQIRHLDEPFVYKPPFGKKGYAPFLQPPGRPNDRAVVIPWRPGWAESSITQPGGEGPGGVEPSVPSLTAPG